MNDEQIQAYLEERVHAYLEVMQALLTCPRGQEFSVLERHADLVNLGLVSVMEKAAAVMEEQGDNSDWLHNLAQQLREGLEGQLRGYVEVIEALLACENGAEDTVLQQYEDRVDFGLVQAMEEYAVLLQQQGSDNSACWLVNFAKELDKFLKKNTSEGIMEDYAVFLKQALSIVARSLRLGDSSEIYSFLQQNLDKLDDRFGEALRIIVEESNSLDSDEQKSMTLVVKDLAINIQQFPDGDILTNLANQKIAIVAYQSLVNIFRQQENKEELSHTLNNLGCAYRTLANKGRESELNFSLAITAFNETITIRRDLGAMDNLANALTNLGHTHRMLAKLGKEPKRNLSMALSSYQEVAEIEETLGLRRLSGTYYNLARTYISLAELNCESLQNWMQAVQYIKNALEIQPKFHWERELAQTCIHLGNAYLIQSAEGRESSFNMSQAVKAYKEAAEIFRKLELDDDLTRALKNHDVASQALMQLDIEQSEKSNLNFRGRLRSLKQWLKTLFFRQVQFPEKLILSLKTTFFKRPLSQANSDDLEEVVIPPSSLTDNNFEMSHNLGNLGVSGLNSGDWTITVKRVKNDDDDDDNEKDIEEIAKITQILVETFEENKLEKTDEDYLLLLLLLLRSKSEIDSTITSSILSQNLDLLNEHFGQLLKTWTTTEFEEISNQEKQDFAKTLLSLAIDIEKLSEGNLLNNLSISTIVYQTVVGFFQQLSLQEYLARTLTTLGNAYLIQSRLGKETELNLTAAIKTYNEAVQIFQELGFEECLASVFNGLGAAHQTLGELGKEKEINLKKAIKAYNKSIQIARKLNLNEQLAGYLQNLANTYFLQAEYKEEFDTHLYEAIKVCKEAEQIFQTLGLKKELAGVLDSMGNIYRTLGIKGEESELNFNESIFFHKQASQILRQLGLEKNLADSLSNLGITYRKLAILEGESSYSLSQSILALHEACEILKRLNLEFYSAVPLNNLGSTYLIQATQGEEFELNFSKAIETYRQALSIVSPVVSPADCLKIACNLGNLGFTQGNWTLALEGYLPAIQAIEKSRSWAQNDDRRQEIINQSLKVYANLIYSYIQLGQYDLALQTAERSRARSLVDLMASADSYPQGQIPPEIAPLLKNYDRLEDQLEQLRRQLGQDKSNDSTDRLSMRLTYEQISQEIQNLEAEKQTLWENLRRLDPVLAEERQVAPPTLEELHSLLDQNPKNALLSFYTTGDNTHILILRTTPDKQPQVSHHLCPDPQQNLQKWLTKQWFTPYRNARSAEEKEQWLATMGDLLQELAERLGLQELINNHLQGIKQLIVVPHRSLHLIPFAALPLENSLLGEQFQLRVAPSAQVLQFCYKRRPDHPQPTTSQPRGQNFALIANATDDLAFAQYEGENLANYFQVPKEQQLQNRVMATREQCSTLLRQPHIQSLHACHHATSRFDQPLESALLWGDGRLTLGELMSLSWRLPHLQEVFLSCCETNLGVPKPTDDIFTLAAGFLCAGANTVISTLWAIDDLATAWFTLFYYQARYPDPDTIVESAIALQTAQNRLRHQTIADLLPQMNDAVNVLETEFTELPEQPEYNALYDTLSTAHSNLEIKVTAWKKLPKETKPYESPYYWAGFLAQGL